MLLTGCRVVVDRDYEVRCVVPRYRRLGSKRFSVTRDDFRTLPDVETPFQVVVNFEPCETDIELRVEDAATGQVLSRAHVKIGPHSRAARAAWNRYDCLPQNGR